jgi:hypothetical protein
MDGLLGLYFIFARQQALEARMSEGEKLAMRLKEPYPFESVKPYWVRLHIKQSAVQPGKK